MVQDKNSFSDYCILQGSNEYRLSDLERLTMAGGSELERAIGRFGKQLTSFSYQDKFAELPLRDLAPALAVYGEKALLSNPATFFTAPTEVPNVRETSFHGLSDGEVVDLEFLSPYTPWSKDFLSDYQSIVENRTVHARMWRHFGEKRGTVIGLHGWTMGDQRINSLAFLPGALYQLGFDVVLLELPYHGRRRPKDKGEVLGHLFPSTDISRTNEAMGQVICDLRSLKLYLEAKGAKSVGCIGMSLGAYAASLWSGLDQLSFCVAFVPLVSMSEIAWGVLSGSHTNEELARHNIDGDNLDAVYKIHCPLSHAPKVSRERLLIIAGIWDKLLPARQPKMLWDHWKQPKLHWLKGGHGAQFVGLEAFEEVRRFITALEIK